VIPPALGRRGGGWVVLQSLVLVAVAASAVLGPRWPGAGAGPLRIAGHVLEAAGVVVLVAASAAIGPALTPFPRPREGGELRSRGVYAHARHPIYGALLVGCAGIALDFSPVVFAPTVLLAIVFWLKSLREEAWLLELYPGYDAYRRATPHRFVPWP